MNVGALLIANSQSTELVKPREGPFNDPPPSAQSAAMWGVALGEPRHDAVGTQTSPDCLGVIAPVTQHTIRTMSRSSALSLQGWDGVNEGESLLRAVAIGPGELNDQRNSPCVADQMTLAAELGPVSRIGARLRPPKTARTELPSTTARDQSIWP